MEINKSAASLREAAASAQSNAAHAEVVLDNTNNPPLFRFAAALAGFSYRQEAVSLEDQALHLESSTEK